MVRNVTELTPAELLHALNQVNDSERVIRLLPMPTGEIPEQESFGKSAEQLIAELTPEDSDD